MRQIFTTEGGVTASKCTTQYLPEKFQKCGAMAVANNTEAEDVVACYKVTCCAVILLVVQVTQVCLFVSVAANFCGWSKLPTSGRIEELKYRDLHGVGEGYCRPCGELHQRVCLS